MSLIPPIVAGMATGGGVTLVIGQLLPKPPPQLRSAVSRLNSPLQESTTLALTRQEFASEAKSTLIPEALSTWLDSSGLVRASPEDLAILGKTPEQHVAEKISMAVLGFLLPPLAVALFSVAQVHLPIAVPVALSLAFGILSFFGPDIEVRGKAAKQRTVFLKILHSYLVNVALERRANRGIVQALEEAATVGDSWVLQRIRTTLLSAQIANVTPWLALEELGTVLGVMHLVEAAQTMRSASEEGTAVFTRLIAQAESLGDAVLAEERAIANARSERMIIPVSAMGLVIMVMMIYPTFSQMVNAH